MDKLAPRSNAYCCLSKNSANIQAQSQLLSTEQGKLYEMSKTDQDCGVSSVCIKRHILEKTAYSGKNKLGLILRQVCTAILNGGNDLELAMPQPCLSCQEDVFLEFDAFGLVESPSHFFHECVELITASQAITMACANHSREFLSHPWSKLQIYDLQTPYSANIAEHAVIVEEINTLLKNVEEMNQCLSEPTCDLLAEFLLIQQSNVSLQDDNNCLRQMPNAIEGVATYLIMKVTRAIVQVAPLILSSVRAATQTVTILHNSNKT